MRQVARRLRDGRIELVEVPDPTPEAGMLGVRLEASVISAGTERATLDAARKSLIGKARARPDQARQVMDRVRTEGLRSTAQEVRQRLEQLGPLGYSAAGRVIAVGVGVSGIRAGDRVAVGGGGFANHADIDLVPERLCTPVPDGVSGEEAAFATLGAIAMQGFRRSGATVGSRVAIIGLGLIGQLGVRIARAAGCTPIGIDLQPELLDLAAQAGAVTVLRTELASGHRLEDSADAVLICASAPGSDDPIATAARLARDRAPVVVVGDVAMNLPRAPFYGKELDLRLSRSYGPGRYDPSYELHGHDFPIGYVRWTEQRNMESFIDLVAAGAVRPRELISHRFAIDQAEEAFDVLTGDERSLAIVLDYGQAPNVLGQQDGSEPAEQRRGSTVWKPSGSAKPRFAIIGAGGFASSKIVPGMLAAGFEPVAVASTSGLSAESLRGQFGFKRAFADPAELIASCAFDLLIVATRHDSHAALTVAGLDAGLPVYVEKPLALDDEGLRAVRSARERSGAPLLVGFNRRHAPLAAEMRKLPSPRLMSYRVNAGRLPADHWANDPARGGGRLLGEGCHFVDFLCDQAVSDPTSITAHGFSSLKGMPVESTDNFALQIAFADGTVGSINYAADAPPGPGKERFDVSAPGALGVIDDFRSGSIWVGSENHRLGGRAQDKGWGEQFQLFGEIIRGRREAPDAAGFYLSTLATLTAVRSLRSGRSELILESSVFTADGAVEEVP